MPFMPSANAQPWQLCCIYCSHLIRVQDLGALLVCCESALLLSAAFFNRSAGLFELGMFAQSPSIALLCVVAHCRCWNAAS